MLVGTPVGEARERRGIRLAQKHLCPEQLRFGLAAYFADDLFTLLAQRAVDLEVARDEIVGRRQMVDLEQLGDLPLEKGVVDVEHSVGELARLDRHPDVRLASISRRIFRKHLRARAH